MRLLKLSYTSLDWELKNLELNPVNLIVAKNATGKSRTLQVLDIMIKVIIQESNFTDKGGSWSTEFQNDNGEIINYFFEKKIDEIQFRSTVTEERLSINNEDVLIRNNNEAWIKNLLDNAKDIVYPPDTKLVLHTNRDLRKYPFLEAITTWAENSYGFRFANIIASSNLNRTFSGLLNQIEDIPELFNRLDEKNIESVITEFNNLGYNVSEITAQHTGNVVTIFVKENGIEKSLPHWQLAQGMFRSLSIIIFIEYLIAFKWPSILLIDDLCEGLDYDRAKKLGLLIFTKCFNSNIQLVATSNDVFLMEVVDIKNWNVLTRKDNIVTALNYKNNQKVFDDFRFTGLSNFDFFSSDFLNQGLL